MSDGRCDKRWHGVPCQEGCNSIETLDTEYWRLRLNGLIDDIDEKERELAALKEEKERIERVITAFK